MEHLNKFIRFLMWVSMLFILTSMIGCSSMSETAMRIEMESLPEEPSFRYPIDASPDNTWQALVETIRNQPNAQIIATDPQYKVLVWEVKLEGTETESDIEQIDIESIKLDGAGKRKTNILEKHPRGFSAKIIPWHSGSMLLCRSNILWANHPLINKETEELIEINKQQKLIASMIRKKLNLENSQVVTDNKNEE